MHRRPAFLPQQYRILSHRDLICDPPPPPLRKFEPSVLISLALPKSYISTANDRDNFSSTKTVITATILLPLFLSVLFIVALVWISIILDETRRRNSA